MKKYLLVGLLHVIFAAHLICFAHANSDVQQRSLTNAFSVMALGSKQLVVVITPDETSISGQLMTFSSDNGQQWQQGAIVSEIVVGRTGVAWGKGLHPAQAGLYKQEGDGKAPAGIFELGNAFGYVDTLNTQLHYVPMTAKDYCIDVKSSPFYNQIASADNVPADTIKQSSEPMRRDIHKQDNVYKKGIVVHHNTANVAPNGSCIFMHVWRGPEQPTAGCTAMPEEKIDGLLAWLDAKKKPLLVTLTKQDYLKFQAQWQLPKIDF